MPAAVLPAEVDSGEGALSRRFCSFYINPILPQDDNCSAEYSPGGLKEQVLAPLALKDEKSQYGVGGLRG